MNGGTCQEKVNGYDCKCDDGFSGAECDKGKVECFSFSFDYTTLSVNTKFKTNDL